jgi:chemotaxis protein MotB
MMGTKDAIIIIKKKGHAKHGHHGGAWKVAYADFVTAMMSFFLVMWIVGQNQDVRKGIAGYFRDPAAFTGGKGVLPGARQGTTGEQFEAAPNVESIKVKDAEATLQKAAEHLRERLQAVPAFEKIKERIEIRLTPDGLLIELLDGQREGFFDTGSAIPRPETVELLKVMGQELAQLGHQVLIDGHTDAQPYSSVNAYTNWELSVDRANAARRVLQTGGLASAQLEAVRGFADTKLRVPDSPLDATNRRISILVRR